MRRTVPRLLAALTALSLVLAGGLGCSSGSGKDKEEKKPGDSPTERDKGNRPEDDKTKQFGVVSGRVLFQGQPVTGGVVTFHPEKGAPVSGQVNEDGSYQIKKLPVGDYKVAVGTQNLGPANPGQPGKAGKDNKLPGGPGPRVIPLPEKYASPSTSGLTRKVEPGPQPFEIQLK